MYGSEIVRNISRVICLAVAVAGVAILIGWRFDIDVLKRLLPGTVTVKPTTATALVVSGILGFFTHWKNSVRWRLMLVGCLSWSLILGMFCLAFAAMLDRPLDPILVGGDEGRVMSAQPGEPSIGTMVAFMCYGVFGITYALGSQLSRWIPHAVGIIGTVALCGYAVNMPILYYYVDGKSTAMAILTATLCAVLGLAGVIAHPTSQIPDYMKEISAR